EANIIDYILLGTAFFQADEARVQLCGGSPSIWSSRTDLGVYINDQLLGAVPVLLRDGDILAFPRQIHDLKYAVRFRVEVDTLALSCGVDHELEMVRLMWREIRAEETRAALTSPSSSSVSPPSTSSSRSVSSPSVSTPPSPASPIRSATSVLPSPKVSSIPSSTSDTPISAPFHTSVLTSPFDSVRKLPSSPSFGASSRTSVPTSVLPSTAPLHRRSSVSSTSALLSEHTPPSSASISVPCTPYESIVQTLRARDLEAYREIAQAPRLASPSSSASPSLASPPVSGDTQLHSSPSPSVLVRDSEIRTSPSTSVLVRNRSNDLSLSSPHPCSSVPAPSAFARSSSASPSPASDFYSPCLPSASGPDRHITDSGQYTKPLSPKSSSPRRDPLAIAELALRRVREAWNAARLALPPVSVSVSARSQCPCSKTADVALERIIHASFTLRRDAICALPAVSAPHQHGTPFQRLSTIDIAAPRADAASNHPGAAPVSVPHTFDVAVKYPAYSAASGSVDDVLPGSDKAPLYTTAVDAAPSGPICFPAAPITAPMAGTFGFAPLPSWSPPSASSPFSSLSFFARLLPASWNYPTPPSRNVFPAPLRPSLLPWVGHAHPVFPLF
ncbi:hypothetical protein A4X13_0g8474, partial [Tilletia indica]